MEGNQMKKHAIDEHEFIRSVLSKNKQLNQNEKDTSLRNLSGNIISQIDINKAIKSLSPSGSRNNVNSQRQMEISQSLHNFQQKAARNHDVLSRESLAYSQMEPGTATLRNETGKSRKYIALPK